MVRKMINPELKPCPFCGASGQRITKEILASGTSVYRVECWYCMACGPQSNKRGCAIDEWNERSGEDA